MPRPTCMWHFMVIDVGDQWTKSLDCVHGPQGGCKAKLDSCSRFCRYLFFNQPPMGIPRTSEPASEKFEPEDKTGLMQGSSPSYLQHSTALQIQGDLPPWSAVCSPATCLPSTLVHTTPPLILQQEDTERAALAWLCSWDHLSLGSSLQTQPRRLRDVAENLLFPPPRQELVNGTLLLLAAPADSVTQVFTYSRSPCSPPAPMIASTKAPRGESPPKSRPCDSPSYPKTKPL